MTNKETGFESFFYGEDEVSPEIVWGGEQRVTEIIGLGSGRGFKLKGINLPRNWNESIDNLKDVHLDKFNSYNQEICNKWGYSLDNLIVDKNSVLGEIAIRNKNNNQVRLFLSNDFIERRNGVYVTEGLDKIESVMIFQEIMANYLDFGWGDDFGYGYIICNLNSRMGNSFSPMDLEIPREFFESDKVLTDEYFQHDFTNRVFNITGRFGVNLEEIKFDKRGLLTGVGVSGNRTAYYLEEGGSKGNDYKSHNVDTPYQAVALHTIVASYINFLLEKKQRQP